MRRLLIAVALVLAVLSAAHADDKKPAVPYGDFCDCSHYGFCKKQLDEKEAASVIHSYFKLKGLSVGHVKGKGRFVTIEVFHHGRLVDRVVFDKRTGRLRSIY